MVLCKNCTKSSTFFHRNVCNAFDLKALITGKKALCSRKNKNGKCLQYKDGNKLFI